MDLNNIEGMRQIDQSNMLAEIQALPDQLEYAYQLGLDLTLGEFEKIDRIIVAGMGGSAIGADLIAAYIEPMIKVPYFVQRDYSLPAWATGKHTLVICSSHSGNTEETIAAFNNAISNGCQILVISTGGKLVQMAKESHVQTWMFEHKGQPRAAVGFSFGLLLALLFRLKLIPDPSRELQSTVQLMRKQQIEIDVEIPVVKNPAKRLAGQLVDRWVMVVGSGSLAPVSRRWKGQFSEVAKAWAQFEFLPELDHNTLAGVVNPDAMLKQIFVLFLKSKSDHPRNQLRTDITRQGFMVEGIGTDVFNVAGENRLESIWTAVHFGDYVAFYLAMSYGVDPTPVAAIEGLKIAMKA